MKSSINTTLDRLFLSSESTTKGQLEVGDTPPGRVRPTSADKRVRDAVYAHIRAIRRLGRTTITTNEIAAALSLPVTEVNGALSYLKKKGVKALNG
jgi:hypothetical protein